MVVQQCSLHLTDRPTAFPRPPCQGLRGPPAVLALAHRPKPQACLQPPPGWDCRSQGEEPGLPAMFLQPGSWAGPPPCPHRLHGAHYLSRQQMPRASMIDVSLQQPQQHKQKIAPAIGPALAQPSQRGTMGHLDPLSCMCPPTQPFACKGGGELQGCWPLASASLPPKLSAHSPGEGYPLPPTQESGSEGPRGAGEQYFLGQGPFPTMYQGCWEAPGCCGAPSS